MEMTGDKILVARFGAKFNVTFLLVGYRLPLAEEQIYSHFLARVVETAN
jgi:hypothetical protein